ncbi:sodium/pantothenate symporter [Nesterenkonia aerolata]|uniref:Sodium/pantothenate symporter n=1 Tax=Nesterenkonia aerolata TaxID=3074079 RepID=A0ABU2DTX1_9MICC|nr:sodium/pantothenate symporter [Nesterenkonia sp. LY-0111]MDR8019951.1 sodium/pantothenate symporter [Nesterenkonia sp. LY-0111]
MRWDIALPIIILLALMIPIALYSLRRTKQQASASGGYYIGGRSLGPIILIFTVIASAASSGTFLGAPGLAFAEGYGWIWGALMQVPAAILALGLVGKKFAIVGRKLNLITFTDFFKERYESRAVTLVTAICMVVFLVAYMVAQFVGGARVLEAITGIPFWILVIVFALIVALYTSIGGFLAAAFTDAAQGIIMLLGGVALWILVLTTVGGFAGMERESRTVDPELLVLPGASGFDLPMMFSYAVMFGFLLACLPHIVVRAMSYRDSKSLHRALYIGPAIFMLFTIGFGAMGVVGKALYPEAPVADLVIPHMIIEHLPGPLAGAVLAAPLAAVMSTVDSMILVVSGAIVRDLWKEFIKPEMTDRQEYRAGTFVSLGIGIIVLLLSLQPPDFLQFIINFAIGGLEAGLFVPLILGLYWKRGNALGALLSISGGMVYYLLASEFFDVLAFGMMPVLPAAIFALGMYLLGSYFGPAPSRQVLVKFWGTQRAIEREIGYGLGDQRTPTA